MMLPQVILLMAAIAAHVIAAGCVAVGMEHLKKGGAANGWRFAYWGATFAGICLAYLAGGLT